MLSRWSCRVLPAILALALMPSVVAAGADLALEQARLAHGDVAIVRAREELTLAKLNKDEAQQSQKFEEVRAILTTEAEPIFLDAFRQFNLRRQESPSEAAAEIETGLIEARCKLAMIKLYLSETYVDPKDAACVALLQAASKEFDSIFQSRRGQQAHVLMHAWQARCEEQLGHMDRARDIYEEALVNAPDPDQANVDQATLYAQVEMFYLRLLQKAEPKRYMSEAKEWLDGRPGPAEQATPSHKAWEKVLYYSAITLDLARAQLASYQQQGSDDKKRLLKDLRRRLSVLIKLDNLFQDDMVRLRRQIDRELGAAQSEEEPSDHHQSPDEIASRQREALLAQTYPSNALVVQEQAVKDGDPRPRRSNGGFVSRGTKKAMLGSGGGTKRTERAVAAALAWIARHQNPDGSWSIDYHSRCEGPGCTGPGSSNAPGAATALGLLPFLAAGQTHETKGPYKQKIYAGICWMISHQLPTGDLSVTGGQTQMYSHGIATIMLCEAYGMSHDKRLEGPARAALRFIEVGQDQQTGGWWYTHRQPGGDTSVFGWQFMALKSGVMAGLAPSHVCFDLAKKWLDSVSKEPKGQFAYMPDKGPSNTMTAVGLLCTQYLGANSLDPRLVEGTRYLMNNPPDTKTRNNYYWYYATQVMHNQPGPEWDDWNRQMRTVLIKTQCGDPGCANGSWDPAKPGPDPWAAQGGRLMMTSLAALTLELYYRYPPLYAAGQQPETTDRILPASSSGN